jgi:hypothetical protein
LNILQGTIHMIANLISLWSDEAKVKAQEGVGQMVTAHAAARPLARRPKGRRHRYGHVRFEADTNGMTLSSLHPGFTVEQIQERVGWPLRVASDLQQTEPPMQEELRLIREELDPQGLHR